MSLSHLSGAASDSHPVSDTAGGSTAPLSSEAATRRRVCMLFERISGNTLSDEMLTTVRNIRSDDLLRFVNELQNDSTLPAETITRATTFIRAFNEIAHAIESRNSNMAVSALQQTGTNMALFLTLLQQRYSATLSPILRDVEAKLLESALHVIRDHLSEEFDTVTNALIVMEELQKCHSEDEMNTLSTMLPVAASSLFLEVKTLIKTVSEVSMALRQNDFSAAFAGAFFVQDEYRVYFTALMTARNPQMSACYTAFYASSKIAAECLQQLQLNQNVQAWKSVTTLARTDRVAAMALLDALDRPESRLSAPRKAVVAIFRTRLTEAISASASFTPHIRPIRWPEIFDLMAGDPARVTTMQFALEIACQQNGLPDEASSEIAHLASLINSMRPCITNTESETAIRLLRTLPIATAANDVARLIPLIHTVRQFITNDDPERAIQFLLSLPAATAAADSAFICSLLRTTFPSLIPVVQSLLPHAVGNFERLSQHIHSMRCFIASNEPERAIHLLLTLPAATASADRVFICSLLRTISPAFIDRVQTLLPHVEALGQARADAHPFRLMTPRSIARLSADDRTVMSKAIELQGLCLAADMLRFTERATDCFEIATAARTALVNGDLQQAARALLQLTSAELSSLAKVIPELISLSPVTPEQPLDIENLFHYFIPIIQTLRPPCSANEVLSSAQIDAAMSSFNDQEVRNSLLPPATQEPSEIQREIAEIQAWVHRLQVISATDTPDHRTTLRAALYEILSTFDGELSARAVQLLRLPIEQLCAQLQSRAIGDEEIGALSKLAHLILDELTRRAAHSRLFAEVRGSGRSHSVRREIQARYLPEAERIARNLAPERARIANLTQQIATLETDLSRLDRLIGELTTKLQRPVLLSTAPDSQYQERTLMENELASLFARRVLITEELAFDRSLKRILEQQPSPSQYEQLRRVTEERDQLMRNIAQLESDLQNVTPLPASASPSAVAAAESTRQDNNSRLAEFRRKLLVTSQHLERFASAGVRAPTSLIAPGTTSNVVAMAEGAVIKGPKDTGPEQVVATVAALAGVQDVVVVAVPGHVEATVHIRSPTVGPDRTVPSITGEVQPRLEGNVLQSLTTSSALRALNQHLDPQNYQDNTRLADRAAFWDDHSNNVMVCNMPDDENSYRQIEQATWQYERPPLGSNNWSGHLSFSQLLSAYRNGEISDITTIWKVGDPDPVRTIASDAPLQAALHTRVTLRQFDNERSFNLGERLSLAVHNADLNNYHLWNNEPVIPIRICLLGFDRARDPLSATSRAAIRASASQSQRAAQMAYATQGEERLWKHLSEVTKEALRAHFRSPQFIFRGGDRAGMMAELPSRLRAQVYGELRAVSLPTPELPEVAMTIEPHLSRVEASLQLLRENLRLTEAEANTFDADARQLLRELHNYARGNGSRVQHCEAAIGKFRALRAKGDKRAPLPAEAEKILHSLSQDVEEIDRQVAASGPLMAFRAELQNVRSGVFTPPALSQTERNAIEEKTNAIAGVFGTLIRALGRLHRDDVRAIAQQLQKHLRGYMTTSGTYASFCRNSILKMQELLPQPLTSQENTALNVAINAITPLTAALDTCIEFSPLGAYKNLVETALGILPPMAPQEAHALDVRTGREVEYLDLCERGVQDCIRLHDVVNQVTEGVWTEDGRRTVETAFQQTMEIVDRNGGVAIDVKRRFRAEATQLMNSLPMPPAPLTPAKRQELVAFFLRASRSVDATPLGKSFFLFPKMKRMIEILTEIDIRYRLAGQRLPESLPFVIPPPLGEAPARWYEARMNELFLETRTYRGIAGGTIAPYATIPCRTTIELGRQAGILTEAEYAEELAEITRTQNARI